MRKIAQKVVGFALILSSLMVGGCNNNQTPSVEEGKFENFLVQTSMDANYATVFEIPEVVFADENGKLISAEISVSKRNGEEVKISNNELFIDDLNGYIVSYRAYNGEKQETKEMQISVVDTLAPVISFEGLDDVKVYTKDTTTYQIPVEKVKASDNLSKPNISYEVFKDGQKVVTSKDTLDVSETGKYEVIFSAKDANGNVGNKTLNVYSVDCNENMYLNFETEWDTDKIYGSNMTGNYLRMTRVRYDDWDIAKPENGGDYAVLMTPILNSMYPRYYLDFGKELPAGTKVSYQLYFEAHETPEKMFTVEGAENCMITSKGYKHNEWITVDSVVTTNTRYISSFLHLALLDGYDTPAYNYPAGIKVFVDNVTVENVDDSYYADFSMVKDHIFNDSTSSYLNVSYEKCNIGGYEGMAYKMEAPMNNKIGFDSDALAFLKVYAQINGYTTITTHMYSTEGKVALNTWTIENLPQNGVWFTQEKTIATLPEYFFILRNAPATVYMYFEFA